MRGAVRRIRCSECGASSHEPISFCLDPYVRYTKWTARFVLALRSEMSITRQAAGYRDEGYLYLKIYDLPTLSTRRNL